jgi:predicted Zn-dependent protease
VACALVLLVGCGRSAADFVQRGNGLSDQGKFEDAALQYRNAVKKDPKLGEAYYRLALAEIRLGQMREAHESLRQATQLMPKHLDSRVQLADLLLAGLLSSPMSPPAMHQTITRLSDEIAALDNGQFDSARLKGSLAIIDRDFAAARQHLEKAHGLQPDNPDVVLSLVQALLMDGQAKAAETLALEALKAKPTFTPLYAVLYSQYISERRTPDAESLLKRRIEANPTDPSAITQLAAHFLALNRPDQAEATLRPLLENAKSYPQGRLVAADFYLQRGNRVRAMKLYEEGAGIAGKDQETYKVRIATVLAATGDNAASLKQVKEILAANPSSIEAKRLNAKLLMQMGQTTQAATELSDLSAKLPSDAQLRLDLAVARLAQNDGTGGRRELQRVLQSDQGNIPARLILSAIDLATNRPQDALRWSDEALAIQPENSSARLMRAKALIAADRLMEAKLALNALDKRAADSPTVQMQYGIIALREKNYPEAERIFAAIRQKPGQGEAGAIGLAESYLNRNALDKALQVLLEEAQKAPQSVRVHQTLAQIALQAGKHDIAIKAYQDLLSREPKQIDARLALSDVYIQKGEYPKAQEQVDEALRLAPKHALAQYMHASLLRMKGNNSKAIEGYRQALDASPDNPALLNDYAYFLAETGGNLDEALTMARKAAQTSPQNPTFLDTLGYVYLKRKQVDSAIQVFEGLTKKAPENAVYRYHLAQAFAQKGDRARAKTELQEALKTRPTGQVEADIRKLLVVVGG